MIMKSCKWLVGIAVATAMTLTVQSNPASAVPTIDGDASVADGYTLLSTQNTNTHFGNADSGDPINAGGGSEIDQLFAKVEGDRLYVVVAGNLETNFNKLDVYIDSDPNAGVNQLVGANLPAGVDSFCCGSDAALQNSNGLTFDAGFTADYFLTFTHGFENLGGPNARTFYAATAHYADLTDTTNGAVHSLGMQLAHRGQQNVLRGRASDYDVDGDVDSADLSIWEANYGLPGADPNVVVNRLIGDGDGNGIVEGLDLLRWQQEFGFEVSTASLTEFPFAPQSPGIDNSDALVGPALPAGLSQGDLIDQNYALGAGGCTDDEGANCAAPELEFTLPIAASDPTNTRSHRDMNNAVNLQMAYDNSNTAGVDGSGSFPFDNTGDPGNVTTGIEFSIPLDQISPDPNNPLSSISITAFVNNGDHNFASNQWGGTGILLGNLGGDGSGAFTGDLTGLDIGLIPGDQFVTIAVPPISAAAAVPEPTAVVLLAMGAGFGALNRRRRF